MKKIRTFIFWYVPILLFQSCIIHDPPVPANIITVHCIDTASKPVPNTEVSLYRNIDDYTNHQNKAYTEITDSNGFVKFLGIATEGYYISCINNTLCLTCWPITFVNPAVDGHQLSRDAEMAPYGTLSVTNTSINHDPYEIKLNGTPWQLSLAYGQTITRLQILGPCVLEAIQLSGFTTTPIDSTYSLTISRCQTISKNIP